MIPFNKPYCTGNEWRYMEEALRSGKISGDGLFTRKCHTFFEETFSFKKCLLTTSCTDALEMAAILLQIEEGDEVIMPAFTFVSTANAFVLRGARIVFADSRADQPNMDVAQLEALITPKTKAIVVVHYAGVACEMDEIMALARAHKLAVVEDAAQAIDSYYKGRPLGSIGDLAAFSFHETKNIISGEGGMLVVNRDDLVQRAEIVREKGTNRSRFFRGEVDKYGWVDIGSSYLPSDLIAAYLFAQLEQLPAIQQKRLAIWQRYHDRLKAFAGKGFSLPLLPEYATNNGHMFYLLFDSEAIRTQVIQALKHEGIHAVFHYLSLHKSVFYQDKHDGRVLLHSDRYMDTLLRLPFYYELQLEEVDQICDCILRSLHL